MSSTGGTSYAWAGPNSYSSNSQNPSIASATLAMSGAYTATVTNASGCTSTASVLITVNPNPTVYTVTSNGAYPLTIGLSGSDVGVSYRLYRGTTLVGSKPGTGTAISFTPQTVAGTYTVRANNTTVNCVFNMSGSVTISSLASYTVTGGGAYCAGGAGVAVGLSGSQSGISYQLLLNGSPVGSAVSGTGSAISFGNQTAAGTYTVTATNTTGSCVVNCSATMTGSVGVEVNALPTDYNVIGGGTSCSDVSIILSGSELGVNYQLQLNGTNAGSAVLGTGLAIVFNGQTVSGIYTIIATNATTGCVDSMTGSATAVINPLPTVYSVTGGGAFCVGGSSPVGLSNSEVGVNYQLKNGNANVGAAVAGTGSAISFGNQTAAGTYTVVAKNSTTGCATNMSGNAVITVTTLPVAYTVSGGGSYCVGGTGRTVSLLGSEVGVNYQLLLNGSNVGSAMAGTGTVLSFGLQTGAGAYTVVATNATSSCTRTMTGSVTIAINAVPITYTISGGGTICSGASAPISLSNSQLGVNYQLRRGTLNAGLAIAGTGSSISFPNQTTAGTYTVVATNASGCTTTMSGSVTITVNPIPNNYAMTGGGAYCVGSGGSVVGLAGSQTGINYQLLLNGSNVGSPVAGTGAALSFGLQTAVGTYTVVATNASTGCTRTMSTSRTISVNPLPTVYNVTGGGSFCSGGSAAIGLSNSELGVNYQLRRGTASVGTPIAGTGAAISFGNQTVAGTYTVVAKNALTTCTVNMNGNAVITVIALPSANAGSDKTIALGGTTNIGTAAITGNTYAWSPSAGLTSPNSAITAASPSASTTYTLTVTNTATGCTRSDAVVVTVTTVRTMPEVAPTFTAYPNPTKDLVVIKSDRLVEGAINLKLSDMTGRLIYEQNIQAPNESLNYEIEMGHLSAGTYLLQIATENGVWKEKIIKLQE